MSIQVSKSEFKAKALEFFRQVEASGEPVVVTDLGQPKLEVRPYRPRLCKKGCRCADSGLLRRAPWQSKSFGDDDEDLLRS